MLKYCTDLNINNFYGKIKKFAYSETKMIKIKVLKMSEAKEKFLKRKGYWL